ncbi:SWI/SNF-related matrix-associated actin-dependent regulator of chromatin subfamily A containing DEAD/H box 1A-like [Sinocyclocheilus rhinocerous]|uniref:SWI/SNF-related matrix-associated actin-dependent regulator of chromatin subfamily A containing DEAD/H box 1A-like n=1 Tax=Sinocyclocheilus rhinocerous TaxID=307959 RepID=UPI0007B7B078|nr:PREDICTED: SWI/SNF-related matrix-associated actin-dependent regulator of chromatin subfamily A containing DEAD/H box 1A-like [Sinocyclocheilus rhinocerous]
MSFFNLDRFRFQRDNAADSHCKSSDGSNSDKENQRAHQRKTDGRCASGKASRHALEDVSTDDKAVRTGKDTTSVTKHQISKDMEDKIIKLIEMFPQKSKKDLLEVVESTSTLEGAIAHCLMVYGDDDSGRQKGKARYSEDDDYDQPTKRRKIVRSASESEEEEEYSDDEESQEPSRERQEALLKKLKNKLPDIEKEVLRDVLREHDWDYENALGSLLVFSSTGSSSPEDRRKQKSKSSHSREKKDKSSQKPDSSSSLSRWLTAVPSPVPKVSSVSTQKTQKSTVSKNTSFKRKRGDELLLNYVSASEDEEEIDSDVESISDDLDSEDEDSISGNLQDKIIQFLQEASLDELALISGCSIKKAQKIISLRPFNTWKDVKEQFYKDNGLSIELVHGCKVVLKERQVVRDLMGRCEKIAQKMTKDVTQVIEAGMGSIKQPKVLNRNFKLQPYQLIGLKWLILLHQHKLSGILADEMGLGKTIQAISFLAHLYENGIKGPHLITVPSSTLDNWVRELGLWCPSLKVLIYYGSVEDRRYLRQDILSGLVEFNIIVSTYNLTIGNDHDRSLFRKLRLKYAVFDEGHMLKNMNSQRYRHLMAINAEHRLLLTGTPLQNNLLELMSLLNFIMPSMFSSSTSQISKMFSTEPTHFDADPALIQEDMEVMSDFELHSLCKQYSSISSFQLEKALLLDSGKFALLTKILSRLKEKGDRVVLFSQFTMMLDIVEILLKHLDHQFVRLDGSTPMAERIGLIDKYNTNPEIFVFLLSTRAGGQGINLTSANTVILHDIDCNPFNDKQAEDRCHRMGQTRTVQVIKLIIRGSTEACMLRVGQEKLKLEQDMTTDGDEVGAITEQMAELLKVSLGL